MNDWTKLETIADLQESLASLQKEIIDRQTHIKYDGIIQSVVEDVKKSIHDLDRIVMQPEKDSAN